VEQLYGQGRPAEIIRMGSRERRTTSACQPAKESLWQPDTRRLGLVVDFRLLCHLCLQRTGTLLGIASAQEDIMMEARPMGQRAPTSGLRAPSAPPRQVQPHVWA
jgi:hypothetical protein